MLMPRKTKYRKQMRGRMRGLAKGGTEMNFGDFGIQAMACSYVTSRQIEASRATSSLTPESSNITRPGLTLQTQLSTLPLPLPIRVSAGLCVIGLSGKILIQTLPPRLILREDGE